MAAVAVFMMIMVAFAPMASIFTDDQGSDAAALADMTAGTYVVKGKVYDQTGATGNKVILGETVVLNIKVATAVSTGVTINGTAKALVGSSANNLVEVAIDSTTGEYTFTIVVATSTTVASPTIAVNLKESTKFAATTGADIGAFDTTTNISTKDISAAEYFVTGKVVDKNNAPIVGAIVTAADGKGTIVNGTTNASGEYTAITKYDTDAQKLTLDSITKTGYSFGDSFSPVTVTSSKTTHATNTGLLSKANEYTLVGKVTDSDGNAIANASVVFVEGTTVTSSPVFTNAAGEYYITATAGTVKIQMKNITAAGYTFKADAADFSWAVASQKNIWYKATDGGFVYNAGLTTKATNALEAVKISGIVMDGNTPVSSTPVLNNGSTVATTDADGSYSFMVTSGSDVVVSVSTSYSPISIAIDNVTKNVSDVNFAKASPTKVTVSGTVTNANSSPGAIVGATVSYTVDGVAKTTSTTASGYSFEVLKGSSVTVVGATATGFTFSQKSINYGKINTNTTSLSFVANEKVTKGTIGDSSGTATHLTGVTVTAQWYLDTKVTVTGSPTTYSHTYTTAPTGSVAVLNGMDSTGYYYLSYVEPTAIDSTTVGTTTTDYSFFLLVSAQDSNGFSFVTEAPQNNTTNDAWNVASTTFGTKKVTSSYASDISVLKAKEKVVEVLVQSLNTQDLKDIVVNGSWFSGTSSGTTYVSSGASFFILNDGKAVNGKIAVALKADKPTDATKNYALILQASDGNGYTFDRTWANQTVLPTVVNKGVTYITMSITTGGSLTGPSLVSGGKLVASENQYNVTVKVDLPASETVSVKYTLPSGIVAFPVATGATGVAFNVASGIAVTDISVDTTSDKIVVDAFGTLADNPVKGYVFSPLVSSPGPISAGITVQFNKVTEPKTEVIDIAGLAAGTEYTLTVTITTPDSTSAVETKTITGKATSFLTEVSIEGIPANAKVTSTLAVTGYDMVKDASGNYSLIKLITVSGKITQGGVGVSGIVLGYNIGGSNVASSAIDGTIVTGADGTYTITGVDSTKAVNIFGFTDVDTTALIMTVDAGKTTKNVSLGVGVSYLKSLAVDGTVTISHQAANIAAASSGAATDTMVIYSDAKVVISNGTVTATAATIKDYNFVGWYADGSFVSSNATETFTVNDKDVIVAMYSEKAVSPAQGIDSTTLIIGIVAVVLALVGVALVFIGKKN